MKTLNKVSSIILALWGAAALVTGIVKLSGGLIIIASVLTFMAWLAYDEYRKTIEL